MDASNCCPYCSSPVAICPHLLIVMGLPGEIFGGALGERLQRLWEIVIMSVGDDPVTDKRGVYLQSWKDLRMRYSDEGDLVVEGDRWTAIYLQDASRMDAVVEACIAADEL
jgi:hypothetical protein